MISQPQHPLARWTGNIYYVAGFASLLISFWIASRQAIINPDAICYLQSAGVMGDGGLRKAMNLCPQAQWPFYSVLIYLFSTITHLSSTVSAYVLDALFSTISVLMFIRIVQELGGNKLVLGLAAMVILLANEFNSVRQYIIRDHGYWAFYLTSIFLFLRYFTWPRWYYAFAWSASLLLATLFRVEGTVFLILLPFLVCMHPSFSRWQKISGFFQLNLLAFSCGLAVFGWLIFHPEVSLASLGRLQEFVFQLFHAGGVIWQRFQTSVNGFAASVLTSDSKPEATMVFLLALLMWYVVKVIANLSPIYSLLAFYGYKKQIVPSAQSNKLVLKGYVLVNIIITSFFLAEHLFLSKRYLIALSLVLMLWVPFSLNKLITEWRSKNISPVILPLIAIFILTNSLGGLFNFGHSKAYIRYAGDWLTNNVPVDAELYSNDYQLMYYSNHFGNEIFQKVKEYREEESAMKNQWKNYDYLAIRVGKKDQEDNPIIKEIKTVPVQVFSNKRGDQVRIYKVEQERVTQ
jgi:hypothetical protein